MLPLSWLYHCLLSLIPSLGSLTHSGTAQLLTDPHPHSPLHPHVHPGIITTPLPLGAVAMLGLGVSMLTKTLTFGEAFSAFANEIPCVCTMRRTQRTVSVCTCHASHCLLSTLHMAQPAHSPQPTAYGTPQHGAQHSTVYGAAQHAAHTTAAHSVPRLDSPPVLPTPP